MSLTDQDKIKVAREHFIRVDEGRADILELFYEDAETYFPKLGFGFGRESLFEMVKGFAGVLEYIRNDYDSLPFVLQATIWSLKGLHKGKYPVSPGRRY